MTEVDTAILLNRINELRKAINPMVEELCQLEQQLLEAKSGVKVGDIITWNKGKRKGRVLSIIPWMCGEVMWRVVNIRKNGMEGTTCNIRPYEDPVKFIK